MPTIIRYILLTASRDWLLLGLCVLLFLGYGLSAFMGNTALVEQTEMSLAYFAGISRLIINIGLITFVCFHVRRSFDNREVETILSKPISRVNFIFSYWLGYAVISFMAIIPVMLIIGFLNMPNLQGFAFWGASLYLEISIIVAFALVAALILNSAVTSVLACFSFYIISRLIGFFLIAIDSPTSLTGGGQWGWLMEGLLRIISTILPRLDFFAKSEWLIHGVDGSVPISLFATQAVVFIPLLLGVALFDFKRKQF